jgi:hypothetical protein
MTVLVLLRALSLIWERGPNESCAKPSAPSLMYCDNGEGALRNRGKGAPPSTDSSFEGDDKCR